MTQERRDVEVGTLLLNNDKYKDTANNVLSYF